MIYKGFEIQLERWVCTNCRKELAAVGTVTGRPNCYCQKHKITAYVIKRDGERIGDHNRLDNAKLLVDAEVAA